MGSWGCGIGGSFRRMTAAKSCPCRTWSRLPAHPTLHALRADKLSIGRSDWLSLGQCSRMPVECRSSARAQLTHHTAAARPENDMVTCHLSETCAIPKASITRSRDLRSPPACECPATFERDSRRNPPPPHPVQHATHLSSLGNPS